MRLRRHDPIAIPLGHVEQAHDTRAVDWSRLDTPTITRNARAIRWQDEPLEVREAVKNAAIEQLTFKLQVAKRFVANNPGLDNVQVVEGIERALAAAERL